MTNKYQDIMRQLGAWCGPNGGEVESNPATDEELAELELLLGHPLPPDYREFLRYYGGYQVHAAYKVWEDGILQTENLWIIYGGSPDRNGMARWYHDLILTYDNDDAADSYPGLSLIRNMEGVEEMHCPPELLLIGTSGGTIHVCIALFGLRPGAIFCWKDCPSEGNQNVYLIANSFDEFIHMLYKDA